MAHHRRMLPTMKRRPPRKREMLCLLALMMIVQNIGAAEPMPSFQHGKDLPQHYVPPFRKLRSQDKSKIPLNNGNNHGPRESGTQDLFHALHSQAGKDGLLADDVFRELRVHVSEASADKEDVTLKGLRGLLGLIQTNRLPKLGARQSSIRSLHSSPYTERDFVVTVETDYGSKPENISFAAEYPGNSTGLGGGEGNNTNDDESSSVHTKSESNNNSTEEEDELGNPSAENGRDGSSDVGQFHPIRIQAVLSEFHGGGEFLYQYQLRALLDDMIRPALLAWSEALRVPSADSDKNLTLDPSQWLDGKTCGPGLESGLPTAHVPRDHVLYGVPETDLVVYLDLGFVQEATRAPTQMPSKPPTPNPSVSPTKFPTKGPTKIPTSAPSLLPSLPPTSDPMPSHSPSAFDPLSTSSSPTTELASLKPTTPSTTLPASMLPTTGAPSESVSPQLVQPGSPVSEPPILEPGEGNGKSQKHPGKNSAALLSAPTQTPTVASTVAGSPPEASLAPTTNTTSTETNATLANATIESNNSTEHPADLPTQAPSPAPKAKPKCAGDYLASSVFCSTNEMDRPTAAMLHICIGPDFFDIKRRSRNILTIMHELGHVLGFNLQSMAHFRRPDGSPITERDASGAIPLQAVECTGPHQPGGRPKVEMALPSPEILQFRIVRGGVRVAEVVTPSVAQVARNHFDCQKLAGAELESAEFLPLSSNPGEMSCLGNHWERRLFKMDLMNPIVDELPFDALISILTLAYFADSGWYQVDLSRAAVAATWGRAAGCAFVEEPCIQDDGQVVQGSTSIFCNSLSGIDPQGYVNTLDGCTADLTRKAVCTMNQYEGELPPQYQYFSHSYGSNVGGLDPFMDYCPIFNGLKNGLCSDPANEAIIRVSPTERVGSRNSRCLQSQLAPTLPANTRTAMCLKIACVVEDKSFRVQVEGKWHTCSYEGQSITTWTRREQIICPDPIRVCPTFYCPRDCLGTQHTCDYNLGACVCPSNSLDSSVVQMPLPDGSCPDLRKPAPDPSPDTGNPPSGEEGPGSGDPQDGEGGDQNPGSTGGGDVGSANFYIPPEKAGEDPALPKSGTALDDIYFPDERTLEEADRNDDNGGGSYVYGSGTGDWKWGLLSLLILVLPGLAYWRHRQESAAGDDDANDGGGGASANLSSGQRRNKDKMVATVLVDLRINDPRMENFRDVLVQRGSETDRSMTDTDPGTVTPWEEQSSRDFHSTVEHSDDANGYPTSLEPVESSSTVSTLPAQENAEIPVAAERPTARGTGTIRRRFFRRRGNGTTSTTDTLRL